MLVGSDDRGVHRHGPVDVVVGVRRGRDGGEDHLPGAVDGPSDQRRSWAVLNEPSSSGRSRQGELVGYLLIS
jgi:hypothetical protein